IDWPRGKPVRVLTATSPALKLAVGSGADWLSVDGELRVDEQRVLGLQQLLQLVQDSRRSRFVALGEGEYLALSEQLRQQLADLQALGQPARKGLQVPAAAAAWLAETLEGSALSGDRRWSQRLKALEAAAALQPEPPAALQAQLRGYQAEGFAWMMRLAHAGLGACLADDMGLGKTVQTLAMLLARAAEGPALVLAPTSVCGNWVAEAQRFAPALRVRLYGEGDRAQALQGLGPGDLVVASYALAQIDDEAFAPVAWATLVLDEAQALKNAATKRAKAVATLQAGFRLALTGTPVENRLADLWSIMNLLNPGLLGSATQFADRFGNAIERARDEAARQRLRRLVSPFLLRRTKAQVLDDLPPRTEIIHRVEPGAEERAFLEATRRQALERVESLGLEPGAPQASFHLLAELTRLRRAACDPRLVAPESGLVGAKVLEFEQLALELVAGRHKALVFSQFTDFLRLLAERLQAVGIAHQYLDGSTPAAARTQRVDAFQRGEGDLFLISLKAGGFGLNLTAADYVIIVDPWWNPAAEDQAMGRAHRIGQQRPVTVYRLVTAGSIEERIVALHHDKRALAEGILEGQDGGAPLRPDELRVLLSAD
uniref:DEAD/DEAH box helicase n=1 Tax=Aquabacterium sp. TaxID=1872578 RepID=UPI003783F7C8